MLGLLPSRSDNCSTIGFWHIRSLVTGHAGAMLQARQLGTELYVGIHSDEAILENKGPTVMTLRERFGSLISFIIQRAAINSCEE
jgi:glycerol-3-phosphate cytidylyltransferase-like family protein